MLAAYTLKGVGANVIYCEEAAYMDMGVFYEVIVPLMEVRGTAMICISTPLGPWNFYTELTEIRDDEGKRVFDVTRVGMCCPRCLGTPEEANCRHPAANRPPWKDEGANSKARAIMGTRKSLVLRELMGIVADDGMQAFQTKHLKMFFDSPPWPKNHVAPKVIYVGVDPNGGATGESGTGSESAVVSFFYDRAQVVVR